jgi:hypothetical protein
MTESRTSVTEVDRTMRRRRGVSYDDNRRPTP